MARLAGVDLPRNKRMQVALTYIYGIGPARASELLDKTGISPDLRTDDLSDEQVSSLRDVIEATWKVEGDPARGGRPNRGKIEIAATRACATVVACPSVPAHQDNARTRKGPKKTIAGKKSTWQLRSPPRRLRPSRREENVAQGHAYIKFHLQKHHRVHHARRVAVISWASSGHVGSRLPQVHPFARRWPPRRCRKAQEHG